MHRCIAPPAIGAHLNGTGPLFQYADGLWNHGEGFSTTAADADQGGWFNEDDGMGVTRQDVHVTTGWTTWIWTDPFHPNGTGTTVRRFVGYLRPAGLALPNGPHPLYGATSGPPFGDTRYVDQGAFELFAPTTQPSPGQPIVVLIYAFSTTSYPGSFAWNQMYPGFHSPDGLIRRPPSGANFRGNLAAETVNRPGACLEVLASIGTNSASYWPIVAYPVLTVPHRQTTLNEQRYLQLLRAVQLILEDATPGSALNPLTTPLPVGPTTDPGCFAQRAVVVMTGGSNGILQSHLAVQRHPQRIHGIAGDSFHPSLHRVLQEQDFGWMVGRLTGAKDKGAELNEHDFLHWGRYAWNQGLWLHDLSFLRRFASDKSYRPAFFAVGDDDISTSGTDFIAVAAGGTTWTSSGIHQATGPNWPVPRSIAWSAGDTGCHGDAQRHHDPYSPGSPAT